MVKGKRLGWDEEKKSGRKRKKRQGWERKEGG